MDKDQLKFFLNFLRFFDTDSGNGRKRIQFEENT